MEGEWQQVAELEERWARLGRTAGEEVPGQESAQVKVCRNSHKTRMEDGTGFLGETSPPPQAGGAIYFQKCYVSMEVHRFATSVDD